MIPTTMLQQLQDRGISAQGTIGECEVKVLVLFSGGKDSQVCLKLAVEQFGGNVLALFCDTKFEHPTTYQHVLDVTKMYGVPLATVNAGSVLDVCLKYKRFPGGGARHCTEELKIRPSKFFYKALAEHQGGFLVWNGVRSQESKQREDRYRFKTSEETYALHEIFPSKFPKYLKKLGVATQFPILNWSTGDVMDYLEGEENPLYRNGFDRVGCFPCLAGGEGLQVKAFGFDETGKEHFEVAKKISQAAGRPVFRTKKFKDHEPVCAFCAT